MAAILNRPLSEIRVPAWLATVAPLLPALAVLLTLLTLAAPTLSPDSRNYLAAAESLRTSGTIGAELQFWPPLYSILLALHPGEVTTWAAILGDIGAVAALLGMWALGRRVLRPLALTVMLLALVTVTRFGTVFASLLSEAVFVPLVVWAVYTWSRYLEDGRGLVAACILLGLAMLTRHIGLVLAIAMALTAIRARRWPALAGIALASVPWGLWQLWTYTQFRVGLETRPTGPTGDLLHQLDLFGQTWGHWLFPHAHMGNAALGAGVFVAFGAALLAVRRSPILTFAMLVVGGVSVLTVYGASRTYFDVDARTMFPILPLVLLVAAWAAERVASKPARVVLALYLLAWFTAPNAIINALV